jgi:hypothetical protein
LCPPGQFPDSSDQCTLCPSGTYSTIVGASSNATCNACPENSFSFVEGAPSPSNCVVCPDGTYSSIAASFCNAPPTILSCTTNPLLLLRAASFLLPSSLVNGVVTDDRGNVTQLVLATSSGMDLLTTSTSPGIHNVSLLVTDSDGSSNLILSTGVENPRKQECPFQVLALPLTSNFSTPSPRFSISQGTLFRSGILEKSYIPLDRLLFQVSSGSLPLGIALGQTTGELVGQPLEPQPPTNITIKVCDTQVPEPRPAVSCASVTFSIEVTAYAVTWQSDGTVPTRGVLHTPYKQDPLPFDSEGGSGCASIVLASGALPPGLALELDGGFTASNLTKAGLYTFSLRALDGSGVSATVTHSGAAHTTFTLTVNDCDNTLSCNGGRCIDPIPFDNSFSCNCTGTGFIGDKCTIIPISCSEQFAISWLTSSISNITRVENPGKRDCSF